MRLYSSLATAFNQTMFIFIVIAIITIVVSVVKVLRGVSPAVAGTCVTAG